jgi:hypothetical protein
LNSDSKNNGKRTNALASKASKAEQKELRLIVDRDISDNAIEGIFITI